MNLRPRLGGFVLTLVVQSWCDSIGAAMSTKQDATQEPTYITIHRMPEARAILRLNTDKKYRPETDVAEVRIADGWLGVKLKTGTSIQFNPDAVETIEEGIKQLRREQRKHIAREGRAAQNGE